MKSLFAAIVLSPFLVSCAEFAAVLTPARPVIPRPLTNNEKGEFATYKEFVTIQPMWFIVSTKSLITSETAKAYGPPQTPESRLFIPKGTRLSVTRFVEEGYTDPNWVNRKTRILYGNMVLNGKLIKGVSLGIRVWPSDVPSYDRKLVAPVSEIEGGTTPRQ